MAEKLPPLVLKSSQDCITTPSYLVYKYSKNLPVLLFSFQFDMDMINSLHALAKYRYECGNYSVSTSYLYFCMLVLPPSDKNYLSALWGKFASEILVQNWDSALEDLNKLREHIDNSPHQYGGKISCWCFKFVVEID